VLENENAAHTFGPNPPAPYLAKTIREAGAFIPNYYGIAHLSLPNYIAMVSGQGPNPVTQSDCQGFVDVQPGVIGPDGQATGQGCVYPRSVPTVADQLSAAGSSWRGYMEDMGNDPVRDNGTTCAHPNINSQDKTQSAAANDQYAARHNPFVYFHSLIDTPLVGSSPCAPFDVPLTQLASDLGSAATTAAFSFITPDLCHDGHDATCADASERGGLPGADDFLQAYVPMILASPAYADGGLVIVIFDEAGTHDATSCCGEVQGPNTPNNGATRKRATIPAVIDRSVLRRRGPAPTARHPPRRDRPGSTRRPTTASVEGARSSHRWQCRTDVSRHPSSRR